MITGKTKIFGVIADPIDHVRAPMVFNPVFEDRNIDAVMVPFHITPESLETTIRGLAAMPNIGGVCVTIPHKLPMAKLCDEVGLAAEITGAVNAARFQDGRIIGDNFDGEGFVQGLYGEGHDLTNADVLMIGAGGAARAIAVALAQQSIKSLTIANRTIANGEAIAAIINTHFPNLQVNAISTDNIDQVIKTKHLIINTTSLGLHDGDALPCSLDGINENAIVADIIMVPEKTTWIIKAEEIGLKIHLGKHMFDYQRDVIGHFIGAL